MADESKKDVYRYTVMVVDDEHLNLQFAASALRYHYRLLLIDNGHKALSVCEEKRPDLILLDMVMPGMTGFELTRELKANQNTNSIPIILLSAKTDEEEINLAFQLGAADYIAKPFKTRELQNRVHTQIKLRAAEKRLRQTIDLVPHRFFAKDSNGTIILANAAAPGTDPPATLELAIDVTSEQEKREEIINLNEQLIKHSQFKDKLFSLIAHDLRIPVLNTSMTLDLLLRRIDNLSKEEIVERVLRAKNSAGGTLKLLENLLEWSKSQFQAIRFNPSVLSLSEEMLKLQWSIETQPELKSPQLEVEIDDHQKVEADPEMFQTILRNLISNAIKFSEDGQKVKISAKPKGGRVYISVKDEGVGMNEEILSVLKQGNLEHLTSFGTHGEKGFGIGLGLAKEFIEMHQGKLEIESELDKGSVFTFSVSEAS